MPFIWIIDEEWKSYEIEEGIIKANLPGYEIKYSGAGFYNDLESFGKYAEGIVTETYIDVNKEFIDKLVNCRVISVYGVGYDRIDVAAAKEKGIIVANVPDYCVEEVSDQVIAFIYEFSKKVGHHRDKVLNGLWGINALEEIPRRIKGSFLFLIGFGRIGKVIARKAICLGMNVISYDPYAGNDDFKKLGVKRVSLEEGLSLGDYVSIVTRLNEDTRGMIGMNQFKLMKKSAVLINTSRGEIVVEDELVDAVKNHVIRGAALDVMCNEPPKLNREVLKTDNIIITPHVSYISSESLIELRETVTLNVVKALKGEKVENRIV